MVPKKLGSNHSVVLLHNFQVSFIKAAPEPGLASFLLEEARRDVPHDVDLQKRRAALNAKPTLPRAGL